ncbi:TonB-dependent siderophore receptor [Gloeocapsa sp. PCC 73106]|uniref:TonB-dependent siderophore receptor n=1 Tax=Gloeocapsa sp. PCC 73106 TaxID=102232 RepID=UPI0002AC0762|nr:TonB-dependent siderophore receptor [Gloeocapsa sp. PCC 73106]ELR99565.1 TonB-dependent siderophore receptor [Gloeocapsa sp. PCC 73106]
MKVGLWLLSSCIVVGLSVIPVSAEPEPWRMSTQGKWLVQSPEVVITGIKLNSTPRGLEIVLETDTQQLLKPLIFPEDDTLVIEILGALLQLPEGEEFIAENPTAEIDTVRVNQLNETTIQIRVTGKTGIPGAEVIPSQENLVLVLTPSLDTGTTETELEIVATGEQTEGYFVPEASTATGTDTPLRDVPQSIQVVPRELIENRNVRELERALETVPGVSPSGGRGTSVNGPGILIRGFDASDIFRDGIPFFSLAPVGTSDIERIEVLKGPASVLFGDGEPGGVVNLISKKPLAEPFHEFSFTAGNFDTYLTALDVSGPINDAKTVKYRINLSYDSYGSFRDFVEGDRLNFAPRVTWDISPNTSIDFYAQFLALTETIDEGIVSTPNGIVDIPRERFLGEEFGELDQDLVNVGYDFVHRFGERWSVRHSFQYLQYDATRFAPLFDSFDEETGNLDRLEFFADGTYRRFFVNADFVGKFETGPIAHQLRVGADYRRNNEDPSFQFDNLFAPINVFDPVYTNIPYAINPQFFRDDKVDRVGVYIQDQIDLLPNLKLLAGVRYDYVDQLRTTQNLGEPREEFTQSDDRFSPRVGLVYQPIPALAIYGSYTTSFNPSFAASRNPDDTTFDPTTGRQFEVGLKADLFDRFSVTLAAFDIRKDNVEVQDPDNPFFSIQTGEQTSKGIELYLGGEILPGWNVVAGYTYLDAYVSQDTTDIEGNSLTNVPDNQFSLWTTYTIQKGSLQGLGFGLGLFFVDERPGNLENTFTLPSYFRTDAALFYTRDRWSFQLNVENLFDVEYFSSSDGFIGVNPGAPFTISGRIAVRF